MNFVASEADRFNPRPSAASTYGRSFGIRYPSPFFDVAQQFLPTDMQQLLYWCRYYFLTQPIVNVACSKMAEYPVTPLVFETDEPKHKELYTTLEQRLDLRSFQVEVGLDYFVYGNAFVSIFFPFEKFLICQNKQCGCRVRASRNRSLYKWKNNRFFLTCPECKHEGYAKEADVYLRDVNSIRLIRWNPENIRVKHNEITGRSRYYYVLPRAIVNDVKVGDRETIESLPQPFLDAIRKGRALLFNPDNIYHLKRPTIAQKDQGWGSPLIYPLLKDAFYMQVMKKAQESLLMEHIVPLRVIYPGPSTGGNDGPYGSYNLSTWKAKISSELELWKRDHNYIPILPVNIGVNQVGGQARALILHQEFRLHAEQMLAGAGIPVEFVFGGLNWSGSNTSLKALENLFLGYNKQRSDLTVNFVLGKIAAYMQWPKVKARFDKFRMADDLQRAMFYMQLNQAQKISDQRLLEEVGENFDTEISRMDEELKRQLRVSRKTQVASADVQGEALLHTSRYQAKAQALQMAAQTDAQMQAQAPMLEQQAQAQAQQGQAQAAEAQSMMMRRASMMASKGHITPEQQQQMQAQAGAPPQQAVPGAENIPTDQQNQGQAPQAAVPSAMAGLSSPLQQGQGGVDLNYLARRAAVYLRKVAQENGEEAKNQELARITSANETLGQMIRQLLDAGKGSQQSPMDPNKPQMGAVDPSRAV